MRHNITTAGRNRKLLSRDALLVTRLPYRKFESRSLRQRPLIQVFSGTSVLTKESAAAMLDWLDADFETRGRQPQEWLAPFAELLKRCRKRLDLQLTKEQLRDIRRLHNHFRNNFAHFTPKGWSIEKSGLPRIIGTALDLVEYLMTKQRPSLHLDEEDQARLRKALKTTRASLGL